MSVSTLYGCLSLGERERAPLAGDTATDPLVQGLLELNTNANDIVGAETLRALPPRKTQPRAARGLAAADQAALGRRAPKGIAGCQMRTHACGPLWRRAIRERGCRLVSAPPPRARGLVPAHIQGVVSVVPGGAVRSALQLTAPQASPPPHYSARVRWGTVCFIYGVAPVSRRLRRHATRAAGLCAAWASVGALCRPTHAHRIQSDCLRSCIFVFSARHV